MKRRLITALAATVLIAGAPTIAEAHGQNHWYPCSSNSTYCYRWPTTLRNQVKIIWASRAWEDGKEMGASGRQRVKDAADAWSDLGEPMRFTFPGTTNYNLTVNCADVATGQVAVFYRWYDDSDTNPNSEQASVGRVTRCRNQAGIRSAVLEFNSKYNLYTGTGTAPAGTISLWGVAAHELGHVTGFAGHWDTGPTGTLEAPDSNADRGPCVDDPLARHTMCALFVGKGGHLRSLELHDEHTFGNAY